MSSGGGGGTQTTQTVQKADPWAGQQPYLTDIFAQAQKQYYDTSKPQFYPGSTTAPIDPATVQAQNYALNQAQTNLPAVGQASTNNAIFNLTDAKYVESNPYLQQAIQAAFRPTIQAFTDPGGPLQQARTNFVDTGGYGGSRHGLSEGIMYGRLGDTLAGTASTMASGGYESGLKAGLQQQLTLPQVQGAALAPATAGEAVGQQREAYAQQLIDEAIQRWNFGQNVDAMKLAQYQNLVQGNYGGSGTSEVTAPAAKSNKAMGVLGGAAAGAAAGSFFPGYGTAIGAGLGALLGLIGG